MKRLLLGALLVLLAACSSAPSDATPSGALRLFLAAMERSASDSAALREAYGLLDAQGRDALRARAELAGALGGGRAFEPWEMLAQGRYQLAFTPARRGGFRERIDGEQAVVIVTGDRPGERVEVPMAREDGRWRVVLVLPRVQ